MEKYLSNQILRKVKKKKKKKKKKKSTPDLRNETLWVHDFIPSL